MNPVAYEPCPQFVAETDEDLCDGCGWWKEDHDHE